MIRCSVRGFLAGIGILAFLAPPQADATPVGEIHRVTSVPTAGLRDAESRTELRVTIWYPAAADSSTTRAMRSRRGGLVGRVGMGARRA